MQIFEIRATVTKLKATVDNIDLLKLGEVEVSVAPTNELGLYGSSEKPVRLHNKTGYFVNKTTGEHETYISIGASSNYSLPNRDTVMIENLEDLKFMVTSCDLLDNPYKMLYMKNCIEWSAECAPPFKAPSLSFKEVVDMILSIHPNTIHRLYIRNYNFEGQNFNALADNPLLSKFSNKAYINVGKCLLTIDFPHSLILLSCLKTTA